MHPKRFIGRLPGVGMGLALLLLADAAQAVPIQATFTADNAYQMWLGDANGVITPLGGDENCSAGDIFSAPESFGFNAGSGDYIYVVAYSDDADRQGLLGQLVSGGQTIYTGDAAWEVFATGVDLDPTCPAGGAGPSATAVNSQIALANTSTGGAGTSVGWVGASGNAAGTVGALATGEDNSSAAGIYQVAATINAQARWMWYDPPGPGNPFSTRVAGETLIFRLRARSAIPCLPKPDGLVAWWALDEKTLGTAADLAGPNTGTHANGPAPIASALGGALRFDGVDDHITVPDHPSLDFGAAPGGDFSIALWIRTTDATGINAIVEKRENVSAPRGWTLFLSSGRLALQLAEGGDNFCDSVTASGCTNYDSGLFVADGAAHFVAVTVDRDQPNGIRWYVDGNLAVLAQNPTLRGDSLANGAPLYIARHAFSNASFQGIAGDLDEIELFNRALTEAELDQIFDAESSGAGKCKESMEAGWDYSQCPSRPQTTVTPVICNRSSQQQSYELSFQDLPAGALRGCVAGPFQFTLPAGSQPALVPPHSCRSVNVQVTPPVLPPGARACYRVLAENLATGGVLTGEGTINSSNICSRRFAGNPVAVPDGVEVDLFFEIENPGSTPATVPFTFDAMPSDMTSDEQIVSLDGREPGETVSGQVTVPARQTREVSVRARLTEPSSGFQSVILSSGNIALASAEITTGASGCTPGPTTLCLSNGRFQVQAAWKDFAGNTGSGRAVALTGDTGYFWFFSPSNVEVVLKVLDGRPLNDHWWVFYGALSTVEYVLTVTDTESGATRTFVNPSGNLASVANTSAIRDQDQAADALLAAVASDVEEDWMPVEPPISSNKAGTCVATATRLCLQDNRFAVDVTWKDFSGNTGTGQRVTLTSDTGYFWFFGSSNIELVLKILDGRALNGNWWIFYGALSSVEYQITVTDTVTGKTKTYTNPSGTLGSRADTSALPDS